MTYVDVLPASSSYKSTVALTYSSDVSLQPGQIVLVPLRSGTCPALVVKSVSRPSFKVKPIIRTLDLPQVPLRLIELIKWVCDYYVCGIGDATKLLLSPNNIAKIKGEPDKVQTKSTIKLPPLTAEQTKVIASVKEPGTYLLHGETGSGKSRVYLELIKSTIAKNQSAIVLTPEIGLTPQLINYFVKTLNCEVLSLHSGLKPLERRTIWQKILTSDRPKVIVGPRSALFSPIKNLGLIVIDECHDSSYKQNDKPHFSTTTVAAKLSQLANCPLILGSATPSLTDYYFAVAKNRPILRMTKLAVGDQKKSIETKIVDLRDKGQFSKSKILSNELIESIESTLTNKEQALLFLNRRGSARLTTCDNCGWIATCPKCQLPLTYHADKHQMLCHNCGFRQSPPTTCPNCKSHDIKFKSIGSKAVETEVGKLFPKACIKRFDADNPKAERLDQLYEQLHSGKIDIIIGTQIVAKGLDLPKLSLIGVIVADTSLFVPDFSSEERTYQLVHQVIGRIGRGHTSGKAIIQTYNPSNATIKYATSNNYQDFYKTELNNRQKFGYPPAKYLAKITLKRSSSKSSENAAAKLKSELENSNQNIQIEGPTASFHELHSGQYHWQLTLKSTSRADLARIVKNLKSNVDFELDPVTLL